MTGNQETVQRIIDWLHHSGMEGIALVLLEAVKPVGLIWAQAAYMLTPFLDPLGVPMEDLAQILEDPDMLTEVSRRIRLGVHQI